MAVRELIKYFKGLQRKSLLAIIVMLAMLVAYCAQECGAQLASLPKYNVSITVEPATVEPGAQARVTSHVTLLYYQIGKDPSVPGVYVEYEIRNRSGNVLVSSAGGGYTDENGYYYDDIAVPKAPGEYVIIAKAYDVPGMDVNGQSEASFKVASMGATASGAPTAIPPTAVPPSAAPTAGLGGFGPGTMELLIIGAAVLFILILILAAAAALIAFVLLRRKKDKPAEELPVAENPAIGPARFCMHCGSSIPGEASRCPRCGLSPPSGVDTKQCASCGTVLPEAARFCFSCGIAQEKK
jgi:ribosomal protein L40E